MENLNSEEYLNTNVKNLLQQLDALEAVPGLAIESGLHHKVFLVENDSLQTPDRVNLQEEKEEKEEDDNPDEHQVLLKKEAEGEFASQNLRFNFYSNNLIIDD